MTGLLKAVTEMGEIAGSEDCVCVVGAAAISYEYMSSSSSSSGWVAAASSAKDENPAKDDDESGCVTKASAESSWLARGVRLVRETEGDANADDVRCSIRHAVRMRLTMAAAQTSFRRAFDEATSA